jgi:transposase-like protein
MVGGGRSITGVVERLGVSPRSLRNRVRLDRGERDDGLSTDERAELAGLRRENAGLVQERDLLKRAAAFFAAENQTRR